MNKAHLQRLNEEMRESNWLDGQPAKLVHLTNCTGMTVSFMDVGATWLSACISVNGEPRELLLRAKNMASHLKQTAYLGAIVGRFANRIHLGRFSLNNQTYQLPINNGVNSLHGGDVGFDKKRWEIKEQSEQFVIFSLFSADGEEGYPGNLNAEVCYQLSDDNKLTITYHATVDKSCPVNLTNHAYFNLAGEGSSYTAKDHWLKIKASHYLPTTESMIPTGELKACESTSFDFNHSKKIGTYFLSDDDQVIASGYDHAMILNPENCKDGLTVAELISPHQDIIMAVLTTKPSLQLYTGNFLEGTEGASQSYSNHHGVALETQFFPDEVNHPEWGEAESILHPRETYQHQTSYVFKLCSG